MPVPGTFASCRKELFSTPSRTSANASDPPRASKSTTNATSRLIPAASLALIFFQDTTRRRNPQRQPASVTNATVVRALQRQRSRRAPRLVCCGQKLTCQPSTKLVCRRGHCELEEHSKGEGVEFWPHVPLMQHAVVRLWIQR